MSTGARRGRQVCDMRRSLLDLLLTCPVLGLPRGGTSGGASGSPGGAAPSDEAPPAKAQQRSTQRPA